MVQLSVVFCRPDLILRASFSSKFWERTLAFIPAPSTSNLQEFINLQEAGLDLVLSWWTSWGHCHTETSLGLSLWIQSPVCGHSSARNGESPAGGVTYWEGEAGVSVQT